MSVAFTHSAVILEPTLFDFFKVIHLVVKPDQILRGGVYELYSTHVNIYISLK